MPLRNLLTTTLTGFMLGLGHAHLRPNAATTEAGKRRPPRAIAEVPVQPYILRTAAPGPQARGLRTQRARHADWGSLGARIGNFTQNIWWQL